MPGDFVQSETTRRKSVLCANTVQVLNVFQPVKAKPERSGSLQEKRCLDSSSRFGKHAS